MTSLTWWQKAVFYQIYPRSFADGNGDGIGDLAGMIAKLDYLKDLGIDAIWLSPHYPSPMVDCGYDISSYVDVAPEYGSLDDFKRFLEEAHRRDLRLILDMVLNHTSDQHPWFVESRSSRVNPKRDWYIWQEAKGGKLPNNWNSTFGGPAWELDPRTGAYYYHFFFKEQPDLNWRNPEVKEAMWDAVRFWLDMGVDGFRLDAIGTIFEEPGLPDQETGLTLEELQKTSKFASTPEEREKSHILWDKMFIHQHDLPGMHELMRELHAVVEKYPDRVLVGETEDLNYYGNGTDELQLVFNFSLIRTNQLTPEWVRANQGQQLKMIPAGAWPCNTLGNHDSPRIYNQFGDGKNNQKLARLHLALLLTLKGTPFLYNGEEIGMSDYLFTDINRFRDRLALGEYQFELEAFKTTPDHAAMQAAIRGRDKNRTPFQWANLPNGGFSPESIETWLPVNPNYLQGVNYADQVKDPESLLNFYRTLLKVRKQNPALIGGEYEVLDANALDYLAFLRQTDGQKCLVALNFSDQPQMMNLASLAGKARKIFSTTSHRLAEGYPEGMVLAPFEVYIGEMARLA